MSLICDFILVMRVWSLLNALSLQVIEKTTTELAEVATGTVIVTSETDHLGSRETGIETHRAMTHLGMCAFRQSATLEHNTHTILSKMT